MSQSFAMRNNRMLRVVALCGALIALAGCTRGMSDLRDWVAKEKLKKGAPIDPLPVIRTFETFEYSDQGDRECRHPSDDDSRHDADSAQRLQTAEETKSLVAFEVQALACSCASSLKAELQT